ncbi:molybdopterin oxidoreductase family protein [Paludibaculum fermentans]|uniref:Molybdopterin oxidoreductase family protein n=1 Tax=Paludibaculum fermentans TaxID=1473598 RepID=A0A7S7SNM1_PALFE|nr:molybdopterin oxidoreductase family protein [Paludibaculum fermentans]QOY91058.1 molybdopterin oxidoreductase family protein [Paludibaculum fermentans]
MAKPPQSVEALTEQYGPHLKYVPPGGWQGESLKGPEKLVKTHCCFCGQQCGIQLKVRDNQVTGFEPWEEFPFNRGMLCPKGVRRYMQSAHPDRLLAPLIRTDSGFREAGWEEAMSLTARRLQEIQAKYGKDSVAVYGGASLITEKSYLLGKFARVALGTRHIDYNGRLCMVSAGTAYKLALGVDRNPNPWEDIPKAQVVLVAGANVGECFPITTDYLWRMRDNGGRLIVADPRMTPITRNADLYLPVRPGTDTALFSAMLHVIVRDGLADLEFIENHTNGFDQVAEYVKAWDPRRAADVTGVRPEDIEKAAQWFGMAERAMALHARGIEHHSHGVENCLALVNLCLATGNIGREGAGPNMITGQGNGQGGREHGQKCDQLPGQRHIADPAAREHVAKVWGITPEEIPQAGYSAVEIMEAIHRGEIKALFSMCFNPLVSLPDSEYTRAALEKLEFFCVVDFFLSETAHHADVVLAGSLQEEEEGVVGSGEGRVIKINKAVDPPGQARGDSAIVVDLARRLGKGQYFPFESTREIFDELREASRGGHADYYGITYERIEKEMGIFWPCPTLDHPGTPRFFEGGKFLHPDGRARFLVAEVRPSGDPVADDFPTFLTTGRVVSQYLSGAQTRRIGALVDQYPNPKVEVHPKLAERHGILNDDWVTVTTRRSSITVQAMVVRTIRPDTVFIPYHWPGRKSANRLTHRTLDPRSKIPEFKVSACRIEKAAGPQGGQ